MSVKIMARVWAQSTRKDGELLVLLALADFANDAGECWPSIPVLAQKARLTDRQTRKVLRKLEEAGEIQCIKSSGGRNRRNSYVIALSENPEIKTLKKEQGNKNPVSGDTKTLSTVTGALTRHRTVNKESGASAPHSSPSGRGESLPRRSKPDPAQVEAFDLFYSSYPRRAAGQDALKVWLKLDPSPDLQASIMAAVKRYAELNENTEQKYILYPATWLNKRRWEDEPDEDNGRHKAVEPKDLGNGNVEVDGRVMTRDMYEKRYGQTN